MSFCLLKCGNISDSNFNMLFITIFQQLLFLVSGEEHCTGVKMNTHNPVWENEVFYVSTLCDDNRNL